MEIYEKYEDLGKVHTLLGHIRMETTQLCAQLQRPRSNKPSASSWESTKQDFTNSYKGSATVLHQSGGHAEAGVRSNLYSGRN
jgi:hypothetical protein